MKCRLLNAIVLMCFASVTAIAQRSVPAWVATYAASPATFNNLPPFPGMPKDPDPVTGTLRYRFGISCGGSQFVVRLSNELGDKPLKIAGASIAVAGTGVNAVPGTMRRLTFDGKDSVEIAPGALILSDPVQLRVASLSDLLGSVYFTEPVKLLPIGAQMLLSEGNQVTSDAFPNARKVFMRPTMTMVLVSTDRPVRVVAALGDSITDAVRNEPVEPHGWVAELARRLGAQGGGMSAVSAGISGNQVLRSMMGPSALARYDRDVLTVPGLSDIVLLEGINDIGMSGKTPFGESPLLSFDDLIAGYKQLAVRAHSRGVMVFAGTLLPAQGAFYFSDDKEKLRQSVNAWIRSAKEFDGVIDFDAVMRDPAHPDHLKQEFDSGDHLHPNAAGYKAMGDAIDLSLFR